MNSQDAIDLGREAIIECLMIGSPILIAGLVIGLIIGMLQAMTQVHDQTVAFVPKLLGLILLIALALPWLSGRMTDYTEQLLEKPVTSIDTGSMGSFDSVPAEEIYDIRPEEYVSSPASRFSMPVYRPDASAQFSMPVMDGQNGAMPVIGAGGTTSERTADSIQENNESSR